MTENLKVKGLSGIRKIYNLSFHITEMEHQQENYYGTLKCNGDFKSNGCTLSAIVISRVMDAIHLMECASLVPSYFSWDAFFLFFVWVLTQFS